MQNIIKSQVVTLVSLLTAIVFTVAACGGGGSSGGAGGGSSGAMIRGTVNGGTASIDTSTNGEQWLVAATEFVISSARADGIDGLTVELIRDDMTLVATDTTEAGGEFVFTPVADGIYRLRLLQGPTELGTSGPLVVGAGSSEVTVQLAMDATLLSVEIEVQGDTISGEVEDDDSSSADVECNSVVDVSASSGSGSDGDSDDASNDDASSDDASSDDCSGRSGSNSGTG